MSLQQKEPDDFVLSTGVTHTVSDVVRIAFESVGLDWHQYVKQDPRFMRPSDSKLLVGNSVKAARMLGWKPEITFESMIQEMVQSEMASVK